MIFVLVLWLVTKGLFTRKVTVTVSVKDTELNIMSMPKDKMGRTYLPPAKEVCEGYVFTRVCLSTGGACMAGGRAWQGGHRWQGIVHGGGHVWWGGVCGRGACMVGGVHGRRGHAWCWGGGRACHGRYHGIRSTSGLYASYWMHSCLSIKVSVKTVPLTLTVRVNEALQLTLIL